MASTTTIHKDLAAVDEWCRHYGLVIDVCPHIYFVNEGAAAFLTRTDSSFCFIEPLIANPFIRRSERNKAIKEVTTKCEEKAKELGYKKVFAMTAYEVVCDRAIKYGYKKSSTPHLFEKEL